MEEPSSGAEKPAAGGPGPAASVSRGPDLAGGDGAQRTGRWLGRGFAALWSALCVAARIAKSGAARIGDWLASIGWWRFVLLSILLTVLASVTESMFQASGSHHKHSVPVDVTVTVDEKGLHIQEPPPPASAPADEAGQPPVQIDSKGVRIQGEKNGRKFSVIIDDKGVRVEHVPRPAAAQPKAPAAGTPAAGAAGGKAPEVTIAPGVLNDPDKVSEAVDAAKDQIEQIVQDQVDRKLMTQLGLADESASSWPELGELAIVLVFTLMIVKITVSSKRRAESRAQVADATAAEEGLKRQLAEAQLKTMQAQVEPHFLFNTLASVDYLIETDPARASRMQKNLIQYLRAALPQMRQGSSTLGQELALCRSYLEILKMRMDERLQFAISMPAGLSSAAFPPMMLQTLVENAIKHGLEPKPDGGSLTLTADVVDGNARVAVSDTGLGFGVAGAGGGGVGLNNVRERLQALFGTRARLTIEPNSPAGTIATIVVPYTVGTSAPPAA